MTDTAIGSALDVGPHAQGAAARMRTVIQALAADQFTGRRIGTAGGRAAGQWLAAHLTGLGAAVEMDEFPVAGAVRDLYELPVLHWADGSTRWVLTHRREFCEHRASADLPTVHTGPLATWESPDRRGAWLLDGTYSAERTAQAAADGVLGVLVPRGTDEGGWMPKMIAGPPVAALPVLEIRTDIHQQMTAAITSGSVSGSVPWRVIDVTGVNIYATFTPSRPDQISVLLTAHYDGVGDDPDKLFPAAADNASGVAVVIETALQLAARHPGIGLTVALLDGEEAGLHGAARHAPQVSAGTFVINVDGAAELREAASVEAGGPAHRLLAALDQAGRDTAVPLRALVYRSDQRRYADAGLPAIGIGMGMPGYQTPAETPDRVQDPTLLAAVGLLTATVAHLAGDTNTADTAR